MLKETQKHKRKESKLKCSYLTFQLFITLIACVSITSAYAVLDEDGDGMSDVWQREYSIVNNDTLSDPDHDGYNNLKEARAGTNPNDWNDYFKMMDYTVSPTLDTTSLTWRSLEDRLYQIEVTKDLISWKSAESVRGMFGSQSSKVLTIPVPPLNDNYESRLPTATNNAQATASNVNASVEANEPDNPSVSGDHSVWWTWKPVASGEVTITTEGSDFDTTLAIYTGDQLTNLVLIDSDDDGGEGTRSSITFTADSNVVYSIQVNGYNTSTGNVVLNHPLSAGTFDAPVSGVNKSPRMFYRVKGDPSSDLDTDNDRLVTWEERLLGTDPTKADTDGDGMSDSFEFINNFDPTNGGDGALDTDGDGVSNAEEEALGTDPRNPDSNGNGINDGNEDFDGDTLTNASELNIHNTDPNNPDTDGDQMPDNWEVDYGLDPNDATGENGQDGDADGDNVSNFDEYLNGTNPNNVDTDGDGTNANIEIDQGSDPSNSNDNGSPPDQGVEEVFFAVGDDSGSNSENWLMKIVGVGDNPDTRPLKVKGKEFGVLSDPTPIKLHVGKSYEIYLLHCGSDREEGPDFDWDAFIGGKPDSFVKAPTEETAVFIHKGEKGAWIVDNRSGLLGKNDGGAIEETNQAEGRKSYLFPVELIVPKVDSQGSPVDGEFVTAKDLKVAKWENSFTTSVAPVLKGDFIAWDRDRFYVKFSNTNGIKIDSIELATEDNPDPSYNDDATEIELTALSNNEYISNSMMLVSDDVDDDYEGEGAGEDDKTNDRSHKVQLGGNIVIKSISIDGVKHALDYKIPVEAKKQIDIDFYRMKIDNMYTVAQIESAIKVVKERYAQVGLKINATLHEKDWPDIFNTPAGQFQIYHQDLKLHQEYKDFIDATDTQGTNVFFLDFVFPSNGIAVPFRQIFREGELAKKYIDNAFIHRKVLKTAFHTGYNATTSHELLHLLVHDKLEANDHDQKRFNLLYESALYDSVRARKRINQDQQKKIHNHIDVKEGD